VVPLKYLRLHELRNTVLEEQRQTSQPRAAALAEISRIAFEIYEHGDAHQIRRAAEMRAAPWYPHAIGPVIAALDGSDVRTTFFLSAPNHGFDSAYRDDDILEYAYTAERRTLVRAARINRVPAEMRRTLWPFIEFERTATKAVLSPKVANVEESLRIHPWVMDCVNVNEMAREVLNYAHAA
jgi:alpha-galactosidase/6-phospho-beta-glucosidase family protein